MPAVTVFGLGNILLGDDGLGPYAIKVLESEYSFAPAFASRLSLVLCFEVATSSSPVSASPPRFSCSTLEPANHLCELSACCSSLRHPAA